MSSLPIHFFIEEITFTLKQKTHLRGWIKAAIIKENYSLQELNYIYCSDEYLLNINNEYLKHNTLTDIITFDNSTVDGAILGDIFISIDRIRENALIFNTTERDELHRVMIHGALHLLGFSDKTKEDKAQMTQKEDFYLSERSFI